MTNDPRYSVDEPLPETPLPPGEPAPWVNPRIVGSAQPRVDGYERVSGSAVYPTDVSLPGMLHGAILRCPHAHALVREVDMSVARDMPGVHAVLTGSSPGADVEWGYRGYSAKLFDPHCRHHGEAVAAVAAETLDQAHDALAAITVDYEPLAFVLDAEQALEPGAPPVHEGGNRLEPETTERGDVARGLAEADQVVEARASTACEIHNPLERHGCVARWDGDHLTVWESTQGVYPVQAQLARMLQLPLAKVRVIGHYVGGGFGSKLQAGKYTVIAALLARLTARPVKVVLSREECQLSVGNRPRTAMRLKAGARADGTLTALDFAVLSAAGAYASGGTGGVDWQVRDLYLCPNVRTEATVALVNSGPARAMRAPGHPQGAWMLEQVMDELAQRLGLDPVELRLRNIPTVSQGSEGSLPYTSSGLRECLTEGAHAFGWSEARARAQGSGHLRRGVGMACGMWAAGGGWPPATVIVKLFADGSANLNLGASDIGTGTKTVMAMVVSEELGVPLDRIQIEHADTGTTQFASASGGSKTVPTEAPAVRAASLEVRRQLFELAAEELGVAADNLRIEGDAVVSISQPETRRKLVELQGLRRRALLVGVGYRGPNPEDKAIHPFAAHFCEVEVNTRTGEVRLLRFLAAQESGRVMNRLTFSNQVFGGIAWGVGLALTEERVLDAGGSGRVLGANLHDYRLPTALDVPAEQVSLPIDRPDVAANTVGAKGLGEPVTIPTAAAIANAVAHAAGVRVWDSPITPARLLALLAAAKEG